MPLDTAIGPHTITATLNYLGLTPAARAHDRPYTLAYAPTDGTPRSNIVAEPHAVPIRDIRSAGRTFSLDHEGFAVVQHTSAVTDFQDEQQIREIYYAEAERLMKEVTGADTVFVFDHTLRKRVPGLDDNRAGLRQPASRVHVDHTDKSGPQRMRDFLPDEAEELLRGRMQVINLWRPINHPVYDAPLAVADASTVPFADLVPADLIYPNRVGETYSIRFNPDHRWYYVEQQRPEEVLLLKCYDSRTDVARFAPHGAFLVPDAPADAPTRESIELRTFVFHRA